VRGLSDRLNLSDAAIHNALEEARTDKFESTTLYQRVFALAERKSGRRPAAAIVPSIRLQGPKIERKLTTDWYAHRVDDRFQRCLSAQPGQS
jgi:hypothetical protein